MLLNHLRRTDRSPARILAQFLYRGMSVRIGLINVAVAGKGREDVQAQRCGLANVAELLDAGLRSSSKRRSPGPAKAYSGDPDPEAGRMGLSGYQPRSWPKTRKGFEKQRGRSGLDRDGPREAAGGAPRRTGSMARQMLRGASRSTKARRGPRVCAMVVARLLKGRTGGRLCGGAGQTLIRGEHFTHVNRIKAVFCCGRGISDLRALGGDRRGRGIDGVAHRRSGRQLFAFERRRFAARLDRIELLSGADSNRSRRRRELAVWPARKACSAAGGENTARAGPRFRYCSP